MKAFLSHSSKDKHVVSKIAEYLGPALCEYDEHTFDYNLTSEEIRKSLKRSDLFVFFLSENSIHSSFVKEEARTALDFRGSGRIKRVMVIALDQTSYLTLPEWLRDINVATKLSNPLTIGRKLESELLALDAEQTQADAIYIRREVEETALRKALARPPGNAPISVHAVGFTGIGRKTFLHQVLTDIFKRQIRTFIVISIGRFEGIDEFYRRLYEYFNSSSISDKIRNFDNFSAAAYRAKIDKLADLLTSTFNNEEMLIVDDQGGIYNDEGDYQAYIGDVLLELRGANRPVLGVVQTRMMPQQFKEQRGFSFHTFIPPLNDDKIRELLSFSLREAEIDYNDDDLNDLTSLIDGNPINVNLAVKSIKSYGLDVFIADPQLLIEWKRRRAEDFLGKIEFSQIEQDIIALLVDYRFAQFSIIRQVIEGSLQELGAALRKLEDFCCIERRDRLYMISPPVHDACGRDKRFRRNEDWKLAVASTIVESLEGYKDDENVPLSLIEIAARASIRTRKSQRYVTSMILPSYFISLARDSYNEGKNAQAIDFCKKAASLKNDMTADAEIELLRIRGLSAVRIGEDKEIDAALDGLRALNSKRSARQHAFFIKGFQFRFKRKYDEAEADFVKAHRLAPRNYSINRELASLYTRQKNFIDAEGYARAAFSTAPTNPYILDVLLECLLGKSHLGMAVDQQEIDSLFLDLEKYGDVPGSSFYQARKAQDFLRSKNRPEALKAINKAIERTPEHTPCYFLRGQIYLEMADAKKARKDLEKINDLLEKRGGFAEEDEGRLVELEVGILEEERSFQLAREKLNRSQFVPSRTAKRLAKNLAKAISYEPEKADKNSREWAKRILGS